jgi:ATPase family protein associated with various cellular activities (AAA)
MAKDGGTSRKEFRRQFGELIRQMLAESHQQVEEPVGSLMRAHMGDPQDDLRLQVFTQELEAWELPNLQLALNAVAERPNWGMRILGLGRQARHFADFGLSGLLRGKHFEVEPAEYVNVPVGPGKTLPCLEVAALLVTTPGGPVCALVNRGDEHHMGGPPLSVQAMSPNEGLAQSFLEELRTLMDANDVYRGQLITVEVGRQGGSRVVFLERPDVDRSDVILPAGELDRIEHHILGPTTHRDALAASGRHLARGLLLWGPPGTGKTHTVRYLTSRLQDATIILLSGGSLGMISGFATLARRLAPSVVILEDVDMVAQERTFGPFGDSATLFELMNQMSGMGEDADVAFVLTTNRPDALEPALAARPGRIDLAVEIPLPDRGARTRLFDLYARGLTLAVENPQPIVDRTAGVTASFIKELLRKARLVAADNGRVEVTEGDLNTALDELLSHTGALTRVLLGVPGEDQLSPSRVSRDWMRALPNDDT